MSQVEYSTRTKKYHHIQESERKCIERLKRQGLSNTEIGRILCRHWSTIGRELKRNMVEQRENVQTYSKSINVPLYRTVQRYYHDSAQRLYQERRMNTGAKCKLAQCADFVQFLERKVLGPEKWSIDAVVGYAKRHQMFPVIPSTKTVYNWVDAGFLRIRNIDLLLKVRLKGKKRARVRKRILGRSIDERPDCINQRNEFAHWECDGIIGKGQKGHLLTLVERSISYGIVWDAKDRGADKVVTFLLELRREYGELFSGVFKSITFDNGPEFSSAEEIENKGGITAYYAHPYSSYERGTSENWNGIVRRFLPKGMNLTDLAPNILVRINRYINQLPRKRFGYKTPEELFEKKLSDIINSAKLSSSVATCCT
ncbi:MAG TPA: IS30 family transposase [Clostridia bacterium]|nr:IS30 family transposase [Clostridia bacterium]